MENLIYKLYTSEEATVKNSCQVTTIHNESQRDTNAAIESRQSLIVCEF